jgi:cation:H+ antiporter
MLITNLAYFVLSCAVLIASGIFLVKSLNKIARFLHISAFSAAFIIMAVATSLPELFVGISSALSNNSALSLGNVIGANILNLTLITGIIILMSKEIKTTKKVGKDAYFMLIAIILIISLFIIGRSLSRIDGVILICFFLINSYRILKKRKKFPKKIENGQEAQKNLFTLLIFIVALIGLFLSSNYVVKYASALAIDLNFPQIIIGLFLLSIATTLPELVFGISASRLKHKEMSLGNQIGTIITNSTLIIGIVAIISPITAVFMPFLISAVFMFISAFIFITFLITGRKFETLEGISLILIYVLFVIIEFFIK